MRTVTLPAINDCHVHLRQDVMTRDIAHYSGAVCANVIAMPNTKPPINTPERIAAYRDYYQKYLGPNCKVHMTAKLLPNTTPFDIEAAAREGILGYKLYPAGATTNSDDGIPESWIIHLPTCFKQQLKTICDTGLVLFCHGEFPSAFCMDREEAFLPHINEILRYFPDLRITLEHISTMQGLQTVLACRANEYDIFGTITLQHMLKTHDDVVGGRLKPENHCMPTLKRPPDQKTLLEYARKASKYQCLGFGSDSAPHADGLNCGCFSAPIMLQTLHEIFEDDVDNYKAFCITNGERFYNLPHSDRQITLEEKDWIVPQLCSGILPFRAGETLKWQIRI